MMVQRNSTVNELLQVFSFTVLIALFAAANSFAVQTNGESWLPRYSGDKRVDMDALTKNIEGTIKDSVVGFGYEIWQGGKVLTSRSFGYAVAPQDTKDGRGIPFTNETRMHVASLSKTVTAIATACALERKNLSWETPMVEYLPSDWTVHAGFRSLTFGDLLDMKAGIDQPLDAATSRYDSIKARLEQPPEQKYVGKYHYQNATYALLRILVGNMMLSNQPSAPSSSNYKQLAINNSYVQFVNTAIAQPLGLHSLACREVSASPVLLYPSMREYERQHGVLSGFTGFDDLPQNGDLLEYAGGIGWYLSVKDVGMMIQGVFHGNKILSASSLEKLIARGFPLNTRKADFGTFYSGSGAWVWQTGRKDERYVCGLYTNYYFLPDDILVVSFVNTNFRGPKLAGRVRAAYEESLR